MMNLGEFVKWLNQGEVDVDLMDDMFDFLVRYNMTEVMEKINTDLEAMKRSYAVWIKDENFTTVKLMKSKLTSAAMVDVLN